MRVITLKDLTLNSSNVSETLHSEYNYAGSTTYNQGDSVYVSYESDGVTERTPHRIYTVTAVNSSAYPPDSTDWSNDGATNRWKMFDGSTTSQTIVEDGPIILEIEASFTDAIGLFNLSVGGLSLTHITDEEYLIDGDCSTDSFDKGPGWTYGIQEYNCDGLQTADSLLTQTSVPDPDEGQYYQVTFTVSNYVTGKIAGYIGGARGVDILANGTYVQVIKAGTTEVVGVVADLNFQGTVDDLSILFVTKHEVIPMGGISKADYYEYFFDDIEYEEDLLWYYPQYGNSILRIVAEPSLGDSRIGLAIIGKSADLGLTQFSPTIGIIDYSVKTTDNFGNTILSQGAFAKRADIEVDLPYNDVDVIQKRLAKLRGIPAMYDCNNDESDFESLIIYGFYEKFDIVIPNISFATCNIRVQGLS